MNYIYPILVRIRTNAESVEAAVELLNNYFSKTDFDYEVIGQEGETKFDVDQPHEWDLTRCV